MLTWVRDVALVFAGAFLAGCSCSGGSDDFTDAGSVDGALADADAAAFRPRSCLEVQEQAVVETGSRPADGTYPLFVDGDADKPWQGYCRGMNRSDPAEYLTVDVDHNYGEISDGSIVTRSEYRRLRIDPADLTIDLLDDAFASTVDGDAHPDRMPAGRTSVPLGWAYFESGSSDDGPAAEAELDLAGTAFAFDESVVADDLAFFCQVTADGDVPAVDSASVASDLRAFTLSALDPVADRGSRMVADCEHLQVGDNDALDALELEGAVVPLVYAGE
jgi:hypothetical protein